MKRKNKNESENQVIRDTVMAICTATIACTFIKGAFRLAYTVIESN